jgi:hypothetical protein
LNTIGPFPGGGAGSSEDFTAGVGYNGSTFQNASSGSGVWFAGSGDGGFSGTSTTPDFFARIGTTFQGPTSGVYSAGTQTGSVGSSVDNAHPYYTGVLPGQASPAGQSPSTTSPAGALAWKWHSVKIDRIGNTVSWIIDNTLIATVTDASATATDRAFVGYFDPTSSQDAGNVFGIIDNLQVSSVPEPASGTLLLVATTAGAMITRRQRVVA